MPQVASPACSTQELSSGEEGCTEKRVLQESAISSPKPLVSNARCMYGETTCKELPNEQVGEKSCRAHMGQVTFVHTSQNGY